MNIEANKKLWAKIVAKAWCDEAFKAELVNNPEQVLKAEGAEIPEGVRVHVVEEQKPSTAEDIYLYLPPINQTITLKVEEAKNAAASSMYFPSMPLKAVSKSFPVIRQSPPVPDIPAASPGCGEAGF